MTTETQRIKDLDYGNNTNQIVPLISSTGFSKKARKRLQVKVAIKSSGMLFVVWSFVCCGFVCCRARFLASLFVGCLLPVCALLEIWLARLEVVSTTCLSCK
mmetsp:Transcript_28241/g.50477  ORF Transcript_28241/g.50477 Transcript_28241/m.50477 type:complete len:102 (+) Transcript_28241:247-552(+)